MMFLQGEMLAGAKCAPGCRGADMRKYVPWKGTSSAQQRLHLNLGLHSLRPYPGSWAVL